MYTSSNDTASDSNPGPEENGFLSQVEGLVDQSKEVGRQEGAEEVLAPSGIPQAAIARNVSIDQAYDLAASDLDSLICARAGQYLSSAEELQWSKNIDAERWLLAQWATENQAVVDALGNQGSTSGSAQAMAALSQPFINREALASALKQFHGSDRQSCRVAPYNSVDSVNKAVYSSNRVLDGAVMADTEVQIGGEANEAQ